MNFRINIDDLRKIIKIRNYNFYELNKTVQLNISKKLYINLL